LDKIDPQRKELIYNAAKEFKELNTYV
jgi:hypothetical protein